MRPGAGKHGLTAFVVECDTPGFRRTQKLDKLGMRGSGACELVFENCEVPEENAPGSIDAGVRVLLKGLDYERIVAASASVGLMQVALDISLPYGRERKQFGRPIGEFQLVQGKLADMMTSLNASRAYLYAIAAAAERGLPLRKEAASAIMFASERAEFAFKQINLCIFRQCSFDPVPMVAPRWDWRDRRYHFWTIDFNQEG